MGRYKKVSLETKKKHKKKIDKKLKINILSIEDAAYIAGILDGEGSVLLDKGGSITYHVRVKVYNTFPGIVEWIALTIGHGNIHKRKKYSDDHKQGWEWCITGRRAIDLLKQLYPYLKIKKLQAEVAFEYGKTISYPGRVGLSSKVLVFREGLKARLSELNN